MLIMLKQERQMTPKMVAAQIQDKGAIKIHFCHSNIARHELNRFTSATGVHNMARHMSIALV